MKTAKFVKHASYKEFVHKVRNVFLERTALARTTFERMIVFDRLAGAVRTADNFFERIARTVRTADNFFERIARDRSSRSKG